MSTFKILVVDDKHKNLDKAKAQFRNKNVELTCSPLFSIAVSLLERRRFDVVLTDLMLPGEPEGVNSSNPQVGQDTPYGLILSILAKNKGVPYVAIVTDVSHHSGPIAWAVGNLIGKHPFVSAYPDGDKNWLKAAQSFVAISDVSVVEAEPSSGKRSLMIAGHNDAYKETLQKELKEDFDIFLIAEKDMGDVALLFAEKTPDVVFLIGELGEGSDKYDLTKLFNQLSRAKRVEQQVTVAGFTKSNDPGFVRLPLAGEDLRKRLGVVASA